MDFYGLPRQGDVVPKPPLTEIYLCSGVVWDDKYKHVRYFQNGENGLLEYLISKVPNPQYHLSQVTPISIGKLRVSLPQAETKMYTLNYLAFNNRGIFDRWFYCFITGVEWLSDNDCVVEFKMDIYQNCAYKSNYPQTFIEQCHVAKADDIRYSNLIPVDIETGETSQVGHTYSDFGDNNICFYATEGTTGEVFGGKVSNHVYRSCSLWSCKENEYEQANALVDAYTKAAKKDALLTCFMAPDLCLNALNTTSQITTKVEIPNNVFGGYNPKNNKLFGFPWVYILADNNEGKTAIYRFEYGNDIDNNSIVFQSLGVICTMPAVYTAPLNYKNRAINTTESITNTGFPICAWSTDSFQAWIAQNKASLALGAVSAIGGIVGGVAMMGKGAQYGASGVGSGFSTITNQIATIYEKERQPAQAHGKVNSENINSALSLNRVDFSVMSVSAQFAKIADDYFTMFGYPLRDVRTPDFTSRPFWNYIKTVDCGFNGDFACELLSPFRKIFDEGVTIWHTNDIGNYGLNNQ